MCEPGGGAVVLLMCVAPTAAGPCSGQALSSICSVDGALGVGGADGRSETSRGPGGVR